jgi:chaperonin GroES
MKLTPLRDRMILKPSEGDSMTSSGLYLPDSAQERPNKGVVIAVGPGRMHDDGSVTPLSLKVGDEVFYGKYAGTEVTLNGEEFVILREDDVLAVIEGTPSSKQKVKAGSK